MISYKNCGTLLLVLALSLTAHAQQTKKAAQKKTQPQTKITIAHSDSLYEEIFKADSLLFQAFNTCDTVTYKKYFTEDLEFYHDLGGLTVGLDNELKSIHEMCARGNHIRRELVKSSLEVYPLKNFGAVEIGVHNFYHTNPGATEKPSGTYKFVQVWQKKDGQWKITRIISYGHDSMKND